MAAEVIATTTTTKKRGRPAKKQSLSVDEVLLQHDTTDVGEEVPARKSRGRPSSSSSSVSSSKASLTASARTGRAKQTVEEVIDAPTAKASASTLAPATKRKTAVANTTSDAVTVTPSAPASKSRKSPAKSLASEHDASAAPVTEAKTKAKAGSKAAETSSSTTTPTSPSSALETKSRVARVRARASRQPSTTTSAGIAAPGARPSTSKILRHAKAFSKQSDLLQRDILQLISQREAAYARHLSQAFPEVDAIPVPANGPSSVHPLTSGQTNTATSTAPTLNTLNTPPLTLSSDPAHLFSPQTIASLNQQQAHHHPPPSLLSSATAQTQHQHQHQVRPYSSTKALPMSTTIALAARQHSGGTGGRPSGSNPSMPPRPSMPPDMPQAPKLSDLPLEQLKKDPRYRKASTRYTTFVVALPFAIVSSYFLWERYREHQTYLQKVRDARARMPGPDDSSSASTPASVPGPHDRE